MVEQIDMNTTDQLDYEQIPLAAIKQIDEPAVQIAYNLRPQSMPPLSLFTALQIQTSLAIDISKEEFPTLTPARLKMSPLQLMHKSMRTSRLSYYIT